jgi:hypothetical protein
MAESSTKKTRNAVTYEQRIAIRQFNKQTGGLVGQGTRIEHYGNPYFVIFKYEAFATSKTRYRPTFI